MQSQRQSHGQSQKPEKLQKSQVTLEQWQILSAVEEQGGFQAAADYLGKSQSTVSYSVQKLQEGLGVTLFEKGLRKATLTPVGETILRRARELLLDAAQLEQASRDLAKGWEPTLNIAADMIFPHAVLEKTLRLFAPESRGTRLDIFASSLSGSEDLLINGEADLALIATAPIGYLGESLLEVEFICVAAKEHALIQQANRQKNGITEQQLKAHRQIVVRDSGIRRRKNAGWLAAEQRWTVSSFDDSKRLLLAGFGFAFLPKHVVAKELEQGLLQQVPMAQMMRRIIDCQLVFAQRFEPGPAALLFAEKLRQAVREM